MVNVDDIRLGGKLDMKGCGTRVFSNVEILLWTSHFCSIKISNFHVLDQHQKCK